MGRCDVCGLVQVVPMPSAAEIGELYDEDFDHFEPYIDQIAVHHEYFRKKVEEIQSMHSRAYVANENLDAPSISLAESAQSRHKVDTRSQGEAAQNFVRSSPHLCLLDIGCLTGVLLEEAQKKGWKAEGIDISRDAVMYCKKHKLTACYGTVYTAKQVRENTYDVITAFQIIEHERDPVRMMRRVHKLLVNGGMVILATPNYGGFWRKVMGKRWFGFAHPEHVVLLDFNSMRKLLEKTGFRDIEVHADTPRPFPLSFAFTRGADYFPLAAWILKPMGKLLDHFDIKNPINPWDDMIAFARK